MPIEVPERVLTYLVYVMYTPSDKCVRHKAVHPVVW